MKFSKLKKNLHIEILFDRLLFVLLNSKYTIKSKKIFDCELHILKIFDKLISC